MYCRKCGKKLENNAVRCPHCGTDVVEVKQRPYAEKYKEEREKDTSFKTVAKAGDYPKEAGIRDNRYLSTAIITSICAFLLMWIPWPKAWGIGSSLWMRILVIVLALLALYHCVKANQIVNYNLNQTKKYNQRNPKKKIDYKKPVLLTIANVLAVITVLISSLAIFIG